MICKLLLVIVVLCLVTIDAKPNFAQDYEENTSADEVQAKRNIIHNFFTMLGDKLGIPRPQKQRRKRSTMSLERIKRMAKDIDLSDDESVYNEDKQDNTSGDEVQMKRNALNWFIDDFLGIPRKWLGK